MLIRPTDNPNANHVCANCGAIYARKGLFCSRCGASADSPRPKIQREITLFTILLICGIALLGAVGACTAINGVLAWNASEITIRAYGTPFVGFGVTVLAVAAVLSFVLMRFQRR